MSIRFKKRGGANNDKRSSGDPLCFSKVFVGRVPVRLSCHGSRTRQTVPPVTGVDRRLVSFTPTTTIPLCKIYNKQQVTLFKFKIFLFITFYNRVICVGLVKPSRCKTKKIRSYQNPVIHQNPMYLYKKSRLKELKPRG